MTPLASIELKDGGEIVLQETGEWQAIDQTDDYAVAMATAASALTLKHLPFTPQQGSPGFAAAHEVAKACGGKLSLPKYDEPAEGVVF